MRSVNSPFVLSIDFQLIHCFQFVVSAFDVLSIVGFSMIVVIVI